MSSKSKKDYAYTILDVTGDVTEQTVAAISSLGDVTRVRVIK